MRLPPVNPSAALIEPPVNVIVLSILIVDVA